MGERVFEMFKPPCPLQILEKSLIFSPEMRFWVFTACFANRVSCCVSAVTIISGVLMLILFVSELQYYLTKEVSVIAIRPKCLPASF